MYKVCIFFDYKNNWVLKYFKKKIFKNDKKFKFFFLSNQNKLKNFDIVFLFGLTRILKKKVILKNEIVLLIHESALPKGRGMNPIQNQIIKNSKKIPSKLILASTEKVDSGDIILESSFKISKDDLIDDIRRKQFDISIEMMKNFLKKYPKFKKKKQKGRASYFKKLNSLSNKLNINKSLKENFNIIRISNKKYPAFFIYNNKKFLLYVKKSK